MKTAKPAQLVLQSDWRSADPLRLEIDTHLDPIGDLNERNAAVHPVLLAVKCHRPLNRAGPSPRAGNGERQLLGFGHSADRKVPIHFESVGTGLYDLRRLKCDQRIIFDIEEILALELAVFHATSGVHAIGLNLDVQHACRHVRGRKSQGRLPFVERTLDRDRGLHIEINLAFQGGNLEHGNP